MKMNIKLMPQLEELARQATLTQLRRDIQDGLNSGGAGELDADTIKRRGRDALR